MTRDQVKQRFSIIGNHPKLNQAIDIAIQVAPTDVTVLIIGENGVGKDNFSKIIHQFSIRKHKPFIAINCGALPEGTIDSELFGHEKGSFTSAYETRKGYFEEVNGGVIFLDEIAETPLATQARLLRILESGEYLRVGSSKVMKTDVRLVAATNKNLIEAIRNGKFREDLFFRLNTVTIQVPPLRERGEDIPLLFRYFCSEFAQKYGRKAIILTAGATQKLFEYHWPGNVRELRNFAEKITVLCSGPTVDEDELTTHLPIRENQLPARIPQDRVFHDNIFDDTYRMRSFQADEVDLLFKMLLEMRGDMTEIKRALLTMIKQRMPNDYARNVNDDFHLFDSNRTIIEENLPVIENTRPVIYQPASVQSIGKSNPTYTYTDAGKIEESLSIDKTEKDLIAKALNKHKNNRKKAASELGISERTLYRKIRGYGLE